VPLAARAQQPAMPVIGFVNAASPNSYARHLSAFLKGLSETGYVDGQNVTIEYRWAEGQNDRLPALVADLVQRQVAVIAATPTVAAVAAKAATTTIPIVFETGADPVKIGLVASLNRPGGNVTGVTQLNEEVAPKRLELMHELVPTANVIALLVNPADPTITEANSDAVLSAARTLGLDVRILNASTERDFDAVFAMLTQLRAGGLVIGGGPFLVSRTKQLAALAARYAVPAIHETPEFVTAGGLISYGGSTADAYHLVGVYTGRILKGEKPTDLPVQRATKIELYVNLETAKALGLIVPPALLARADELIE
jgi:putative tryptophan/tyrosine transport system substrate-binding protein